MLLTSLALPYVRNTESRRFVHELNRSKHIAFVSFHNAAIHHHFIEHEVSLLQVKHDIQFALQSTQSPLLSHVEIPRGAHELLAQSNHRRLTRCNAKHMVAPNSKT